MPGCARRGHAPASTQFPALPGVQETRSPSPRRSPGQDQSSAALCKHTRGHRSPTGAHAPVPGAGAPQGHSRRSHLAPVPGCCAKTKGRAGHLPSPPAARSLCCPPPGTQDRSASSQMGTPHLRVRTPAPPASCPPDLRQGSSGTEEPGGPYPDSPAVVHSHRTPAPPQPAVAAAFSAHGCYREGPSDPAGAFLMSTSRGARVPARGFLGDVVQEPRSSVAVFSHGLNLHYRWWSISFQTIILNWGGRLGGGRASVPTPSASYGSLIKVQSLYHRLLGFLVWDSVCGAGDGN